MIATETQSELAIRGVEDLAELRKLLELQGGAAGGALAKFADAVDQLLNERRGMAEELLGVYEQLGLVFALARELPRSRSEQETIQRFIATLQKSFPDRVILLAARMRGEGEWTLSGDFPLTDSLTCLLDRCAREHSTFVESGQGLGLRGVNEVMLGWIASGDQVEQVVLLAHLAENRAFRVDEMQLIESLTRLCGDLLRNQHLLRELRSLSIAVVRSLVNAVDQKDQYTCGHSLRVAYFATLLGRQLHLGGRDLQMLQWAALLHDVGKIGIRDSVLKKEGKLTEEEYEHIKEHPLRSHQMVKDIPQLGEALEGILHHHERFDGSGYPHGLSGKEIPLQARIIQIADVFDALTSTRSYRPAYEADRALEIMREEAGKALDPELCALFERMIREMLSEGGDAWARLVRQANEFDEDLEGHLDAEYHP